MSTEAKVGIFTLLGIALLGIILVHLGGVKISNDTYTKYFSEGVKAKEITETIEKALAFYFENMEEN